VSRDWLLSLIFKDLNRPGFENSSINMRNLGKKLEGQGKRGERTNGGRLPPEEGPSMKQNRMRMEN